MVLTNHHLLHGGSMYGTREPAQWKTAAGLVTQMQVVFMVQVDLVILSTTLHL